MNENIDLLIHRAQGISKADLHKAIRLLDEALAMAHETNHHIALAHIIFEKAVIYDQHQQYKKALGSYQEALLFMEQNHLRELSIECNSALSKLFIKLGDLPASLHHLLKQASLFNVLNDKQGTATINAEIGNFYVLLNDHIHAINYFKKALKLNEELKNETACRKNFLALAKAYIRIKDLDKAHYYVVRSSRKQIIFETEADFNTQAQLHQTLAELFQLQKQYDKAIMACQDGLQCAMDGAGIVVKTNLRTQLGTLYMELLQYDKAIACFEKALATSQASPNETNRTIILKLLSECYEANADFDKALFFYKQYFEEDRKLFDENMNIKVKGLQIKYDLDELKKQKEIAELSDKLKEQFLANVSHEIRTPMNGVLGMTHLLHQTLLTDEQREYIQAITQSANNLMVIINDILDFSKINAGKIELSNHEFNPREVVKGVIQLLQVKANEKNIKLSCIIDYNLADYIWGDAIRLNQILTNLVGNAIKFTDQGKVTLEIQELENDGTYTKLRFKVKDTGIGIPIHKLQAVFESFEQADNNKRRYEGTGLGLTIVKQLVELQGGQISVKSKEGEGATFIADISFKIASQSNNAINTNKVNKNTVQTITKQNFNHVNILVVEDNKVNQLLVKNMLSKFGFGNVTTVDRPSKAFELFDTNNFDLILMDIQMPEMDGYEATKIIRSKFKALDQTPIIAITADASEKEKIKAREAGMIDYVVKPYTPDELLNCLQKYVKHAEVLPEISSGLNLDFLNKFTGGDRQLTIQLIEIFLKQVPDALQQMDAHVASKNYKELFAVAHKTKSSISIFEFNELKNLLLEIEECCKELTNLDTIPGIYTMFKNGCFPAIDELKMALQKLLNQ